jgi:membrane protein implicated in regulation of membrane protease activity
MSTLRTLKKRLFGETWLLPIGIAIVIAAALFIRAPDPELWAHAGGFILLLGVIAVLLTCVRRTARRKPPALDLDASSRVGGRSARRARA